MRKKLRGLALERFLTRNEITAKRYEEAFDQGLPWCSKCRQFLDQGLFTPRKNRPGRFFCYCRKCSYEVFDHVKWQKDNPGKLAGYHQKYYRKNKNKIWRCRRSSELKRDYGITIEDYERMVAEQKGACAICEREPQGNPKNPRRVLFVDHNHETGQVRGLLCPRCNAFVAYIENHGHLLDKLRSYLEKL